MNSYAPPKLRQVVTEAVFRRRRTFLLTLYVVLGLALLVTFLMRKKYEAQAKLMVQNVRTTTPLSTSQAEHLMQPNDVSTAEINSEVDLLMSPGVARRALGMGTEGTVTTAEQKRITEFEKSLKVENVHQTNLINVTLEANSPEEAEALLKKLLDAYFAARSESMRSGGTVEFFDAQAQEKAKQLQHDQDALTAFEVEHHIANLDDEKKLQINRVAGLEDQLAAAQTALARQQSKIAAERRELAITPVRSKTVQRTITNQYTQERLNTNLVDLMNRRTELLKRYPPTDRQVIETEEKIATTEQAIKDAKQNPAAESVTDVNPTWQQLNTDIASASGEASGYAAQMAELRRLLGEARARMVELEKATAADAVLARNVQQSQADYTLYTQKRDEAKISAALDTAHLFDVSMVQAPVASREPVRPKPVLYLSAAAVFGLLLAVLLALYTDNSAAQVYTPAQLDAMTGTRTMATFADEDDGARFEDANRVEARRVLVAISQALGADGDAPGASARPTAPSAVNGVVVGPSGHDEAVAQQKGRPAGYCVAFTSALSGEGVSELVARIAAEGSRQAASRVAVIDARALLHRYERYDDVNFAMKFDAGRRYWRLDTSAPENGAAARGGQGQFSARLRPLLIQARKQFDFLLLDCPSLRESTLAMELDACVDGYVGVVGANQARKQNVEALSAAIAESRAPLLGFVLNRRRYPVPGWLHRVIW